MNQRTSKNNLSWPREVQMPFSPGSVGLEPNAKMYEFDGCTVVIGSTLQTGWHLSISRQDRYPTWDEIAHARYTLLSKFITMAMLLPPIEDYVNIHPNCFHLWQIPNEYAR